jgi:FkbM family methyltransferase
MDRLGRRIFLDGYSDRDLAILMDSYLKPGMTVFDLGAHVGQFTLMAAKRVGWAGEVHSWEPTRETFRQLEENVRLNGFARVSLNRSAVLDEPSEVQLHVCGPGRGDFNSVGKPSRGGEVVVGLERVPAIRLDDYCLARGVEQVHFLKMDVEGSELRALRGGRLLFSSEKAPPISIEFNERACAAMGYRTLDLYDTLCGFGYGLFRFLPTSMSLLPEARRQRYEQTVNLIATRDPEAFQRALGT